MADKLLLRGGRVLDPGLGLDGSFEILIQKGQIIEIQEKIAAPESTKVLDVYGKLVTPGFIDLHAHVARDLVLLAVDPDQAGIDTGVTTVCDAGSVGWVNFHPFHKFIVSAAKTRVLSFLHMAPFGEALMPEIGYDVFDQGAFQDVLHRNRGVIRGIKIRLVEDVLAETRVDILGLAVRIARESGLPLMVHIGLSSNTKAAPETISSATERLLGLLAAGDVITHAYTDKPGAVFNLQGEPVAGLDAALQRGVLLDAAPGRGHLNFDLARAAIARGYKPSALGTDVVQTEDDQPHFYNVAAVMSKFMALGLNLGEAVAAVTNHPARIAGMADDVGMLAVGRSADLTISDLHEGHFMFHDGRAMNIISGSVYICPQYCLRQGKVFAVRESFREHLPTPDFFQTYMRSELEKIQRRRSI